MLIRKQAVYDRFRCTASQCQDSCCKEWDVEVDEASAAAYRALPGPLGDKLRQVLVTGEDGTTFMTIENGRCPMWRPDGLCRIQAELGEEALCNVCAEFPRLRHDYGDFVELGLELSCPEAARLILTSPFHPSVTYEVPGGEAPEYDRETMDILLDSRQKMLDILQMPLPLGSALALGLLYSYHVQAMLDGFDPEPFDIASSLEEAISLAKPAAFLPLLRFYGNLEILTPQWRDHLAHPYPGAWSDAIRALARYGIDRYWLQAVSDLDLTSRVKMILASCLLVKTLGGDPVQTAQLYSKEIENNTDNIDAILDAAYTDPAFSDTGLLWLLLH